MRVTGLDGGALPRTLQLRLCWGLEDQRFGEVDANVPKSVSPARFHGHSRYGHNQGGQQSGESDIP